ncbi:PTS glucose transporter subunit IIA [Pseudoalteromonas fenneropenaei]|uniref:PTS glucose transporter subunit IIA n=1 Tax=Pseudoalteromonas fenneropenaei TaxID=1737459 RepID=A0ABV7CF46_9GAMM
MQTTIQYCPITQIAAPLFNVASPFSGKVHPLTQHPEALFATSLLGQGVVVEHNGPLMVSPFDGEIEAIKRCGSEWIVRNQHIRCLLNLHLPDLYLSPEYLKLQRVNLGPVALGEPLLRLDLPSDIKPIAAVVILKPYSFSACYYPLKQVRAGKDPLLTVT